jgi:hypothetical protein
MKERLMRNRGQIVDAALEDRILESYRSGMSLFDMTIILCTSTKTIYQTLADRGEPKRQRPAPEQCINGCAAPAYALGLCRRCYARHYKERLRGDAGFLLQLEVLQYRLKSLKQERDQFAGNIPARLEHTRAIEGLERQINDLKTKIKKEGDNERDKNEKNETDHGHENPIRAESGDPRHAVTRIVQ